MNDNSWSAVVEPDSIVYIDTAYDLAELARQDRRSFLSARNRGGLFRRVYAIHPVAGLLAGESAGRIRIARVGKDQVVLDGFSPGVEMNRGRKFLNLFFSQARMWIAAIKLARRPRVCMVVASDVLYLGLMALISAKLAGKPFAVAAYQNQDEIYDQSGKLAFPRLLPWRILERLAQRIVLPRADVVEAPTENMRGYLLRNGAREDRIAILPVARFIDPLHFIAPEHREPVGPLLARWNIDPDARRLVMISRLIDIKLVHDGLSAMIAACMEFPGTVGIILGEGGLRGAMQERIDAAGVTSRIIMAGKVDQATLSRLCVNSVIISPLTGMALVEASLAGGVPIAYDRDWQPEFVKDGINGFIVPFRDIDAMAQRVAMLLRDQNLFARMSAASRQVGLAFSDPDLHRAREQRVFGKFFRGPVAGGTVHP